MSADHNKNMRTSKIVFLIITLLTCVSLFTILQTRHEEAKDPLNTTQKAKKTPSHPWAELSEPVGHASVEYAKLLKAFGPLWKEIGTDEDGKTFEKWAADPDFQKIGAFCQGYPLYVLSSAGMAGRRGGEDIPLEYTGSGGDHYWIFELTEKGAFLQVFSDNVISFLGADSSHVSLKKNCPDIWVELHGSAFNRVGYDYDTALLRFDFRKKEYKIFIPQDKMRVGNE